MRYRENFFTQHSMRHLGMILLMLQDYTVHNILDMFDIHLNYITFTSATQKAMLAVQNIFISQSKRLVVLCIRLKISPTLPYPI